MDISELYFKFKMNKGKYELSVNLTRFIAMAKSEIHVFTSHNIRVVNLIAVLFITSFCIL